MTAPLKIAMVTTFYPPYSFGGDGVYVRRLSHALARRGHEVHVIHDEDAYRVGGGEARQPLEEPAGVHVHRLRSRNALLSCLATQQLGRPLVHGERIRAILEDDFDVIHFHNVSLVGGPGVLQLGDAIKLYTAHEHWLVCPTHILWRYGREPCTERTCLRCTLKARRPPQLWRGGSLLRDMSRHVDAFLALSEFSRQKHADYGFPAPMRTFPSFLPDAPPDAASDGGLPQSAAGERPYFFFAGRLEAIKGLDEVIPLFDDTLAADLWVAGAGAEEQRLRSLAEGRPGVRFLGLQPPDAMHGLYRGAVAAVIPSRCYEAFPLVVLEALRAGTPVIARRLGPFPEIAEKTGALLLFDDAQELRTHLQALSHDAHLRDTLGRRGREVFTQTWSEQVVVARYLELVRELAASRGRSQTLRKLPRSGGEAVP